VTRVILQVHPSLVPPAALLEQRPFGRDNDAVQRMLANLIEVAQAADELGYWAITTCSTTSIRRGSSTRPRRSFSTSGRAGTRSGALQESLRLPGEEAPVPAPGERLAGRLLRSGRTR
jgi:hypothetical protein